MLTAMEIRYEPEALDRLIKMWPHPEGGKGTSAYVVSKAIGMSQQSILNLSNPDNQNANPSLKVLRKIEKFFEGTIKFVVDSSNRINNEDCLNELEAFLDKNLYKKAS